MKTIGFTFCILVTFLLLTAGCTTPKPEPNPLAGWHICRDQDPNRFDKAITDDYKRYIQELPPEERRSVTETSIWFLEDGAGQHAVNFQIPHRGVYHEHVLIYDKTAKRIKVQVYLGGRYRS